MQLTVTAGDIRLLLYKHFLSFRSIISQFVPLIVSLSLFLSRQLSLVLPTPRLKARKSCCKRISTCSRQGIALCCHTLSRLLSPSRPMAPQTQIPSVSLSLSVSDSRRLQLFLMYYRLRMCLEYASDHILYVHTSIEAILIYLLFFLLDNRDR